MDLKNVSLIFWGMFGLLFFLQLILLYQVKLLNKDCNGLCRDFFTLFSKYNEILFHRILYQEKKKLIKKGVRAGAAITETAHLSISRIPFGILESIPSTAKTAQKVKIVHDNISHLVYRIIKHLSAE